MNDQTTHDSVLAELLGLMKDSAALSNKVASLGAATKAHQIAKDASDAAAARLVDLEQEIENGIAVMREKFDAQLKAERDTFDREHGELMAAATKDRAAASAAKTAAETDRAAAAKARAAAERKLKAFEAA